MKRSIAFLFRIKRHKNRSFPAAKGGLSCQGPGRWNGHPSIRTGKPIQTSTRSPIAIRCPNPEHENASGSADTRSPMGRKWLATIVPRAEMGPRRSACGAHVLYKFPFVAAEIVPWPRSAGTRSASTGTFEITVGRWKTRAENPSGPGRQVRLALQEPYTAISGKHSTRFKR